MAKDDREIASRIDSAIRALKSDFDAVHQGLSRQVAATNERIGELVWALESKRSGGGTDRERKAAAGQRAAAGGERTEGAGSQHVSALERNLAELKSEIAMLRTQESWLVTANQDLSERLLLVRTEARIAARSLAEAQAAARQHAKTLAAKEEEIGVLRRQVERLEDGAPEPVRLLSNDLTALRQENARLIALMEEAEAKAEAQKTQQRILVESFFSGGRACRIGELLVSAGVIRREQLDEALKEQEADRKKLVGSILLEKGAVREDEVTQAVACQCRIPFVSLDAGDVSRDAAALIDARTCRAHQCIPVRCDSERVFVAMANPRDNAAYAAMEHKCGRRVIPLAATPGDVSSAIQSVFGPH